MAVLPKLKAPAPPALGSPELPAIALPRHAPPAPFKGLGRGHTSSPFRRRHDGPSRRTVERAPSQPLLRASPAIPSIAVSHRPAGEVAPELKQRVDTARKREEDAELGSEARIKASVKQEKLSQASFVRGVRQKVADAAAIARAPLDEAKRQAADKQAAATYLQARAKREANHPIQRTDQRTDQQP